MADDDRKLSWRAINWGSISSILCLDNEGRSLEGARWQSKKIWWLGNYAIWKCRSRQAIICSFRLLRLQVLTLKNEEMLLVWRNSEWVYLGKNQRQQTGLTHYFSSQQCVCFFHNKKNMPEVLELSGSNDCRRLPCALWGLIPAVSVMCRGYAQLSQSVILSVRWRVWGHGCWQDRGLWRASEDRSLKWGQTADRQSRWTPEHTHNAPRPFALKHGKNTSIF